MRNLLVLAAFFALGSAAASAGVIVSPGTYGVDLTGSEVAFNVTNFLVTSVDGHFKLFDGTIQVINPFEGSQVQATADVRSLDTGNEGRDHHLRSADYFEAERFPAMLFKSSQITGKPDDFKMTGELTIKGVAKAVTFECRTEAAADGVPVITAVAKINRQDFGITSGGSIKNTVRLNLRIRLLAKKVK